MEKKDREKNNGRVTRVEGGRKGRERRERNKREKDGANEEGRRENRRTCSN